MRTVVAVAVLTFLPLERMSRAGKYSELAWWEGRYPSNGMSPGELTGGLNGRGGGAAQPKRNFFEIPEIGRTLRRLLAAQDYERVTKTLAVETPIEKVDGYLAVKVCRPHNCPGENATVLVGLREDNILVIIFDASVAHDGEHATRCYSTGVQLSALSDAIKESVLEAHIPLMYAGEKVLPKNSWINRVKCKVPSADATSRR